jgi:hypothetical protein
MRERNAAGEDEGGRVSNEEAKERERKRKENRLLKKVSALEKVQQPQSSLFY